MLAGVPDEAGAFGEIARVSVGDVGVVAGVVEVEPAVEEQDESGADHRADGVLAREAHGSDGDAGNPHHAEHEPGEIHAKIGSPVSSVSVQMVKSGVTPSPPA